MQYCTRKAPILGLCLDLSVSTLLALAAFTSAAQGQFVDACQDAPSVGVGTYSFNLQIASSNGLDLEPSCADDRRPFIDQWIKFVPITTGPYEISTIGLTSGDTVLAAYEPYCDFLPFYLVACNDDFQGTQSRMLLSVTAGQEYLIRVAGANETRPQGSVSIESIPPLDQGDTCSNPAAAVLGENTYDVTRSYEDGFACFGFRDVWFTFTPIESGALTIHTCGIREQANIAAFDGCNGNVLACSDAFECSAAFGVQAGVPILIRLANEDATGPESFFIELNPTGLPTNDECEAPLPASLGDTPFNNTFATLSRPVTCGGGGPFNFNAGLDVWYSFTPPQSGTYDISTVNSIEIRDTVLAVYPSCEDNLIACNDDGYGFLSLIRTPLVGGQTYLIQVCGAGLPLAGTPIDRGEGILSIRQSVPPTNDECATAAAIAPGITAYNLYDATTGDAQPLCTPSNLAMLNDIWYRYVPTSNEALEVSLLPGGAGGSLTVYRNSCDDGAIAQAGYFYDLSLGLDAVRIVLDAEANVPLLFQVSYLGFPSETIPVLGEGEIYVGPPTTPVIPNDLCQDALPVSEGVVPINLVGSIKDCTPLSGPALDTAIAASDNDIYYRYQPANAGTVYVTINDGIDYPYYDGLVVSIHEACNAVPLASSLAFGDAPLDFLSFEANSGQEYIIRVASILRFGSQNIQSGNIVIGDAIACGCPADFNQDGGVDGGDVEAFFTDWADADPCADTNQDGGVDGGDVEAFFIVWEMGGCE